MPVLIRLACHMIHKTHAGSNTAYNNYIHLLTNPYYLVFLTSKYIMSCGGDLNYRISEQWIIVQCSSGDQAGGNLLTYLHIRQDVHIIIEREKLPFQRPRGRDGGPIIEF